MKTLKFKYTVVFFFIITFKIINSIIYSQVPDKMIYQIAILNPNNEIISDKPVGIRIQIKQGTQFGAAVYVETHATETNSNGLVTLEIGGGTNVLGAFSDIDWTKGPYFLQTEIDVNGGNNYMIYSTGRMESLPYAFFANTADSVSGGITETDPVFNASVAKGITITDTIRWNNKLNKETQNLADVLAQNNDGRGYMIKNIEAPAHINDVATKAYVDNLETMVSEMEQLLIGAGLYNIKDVEGNVYQVEKIGNQIWMAENLKTTRYNDGIEIPYMYSDEYHYINSPAFYWLENNKEKYGNTYGPLYNYYVIETGKLCPAGWRIPDNSDWEALANELGGRSVAGGKMKETGTAHWLSPNTGASNSSGFTALPGSWLDGYHSRGGGGFGIAGETAYWWSVTNSGYYADGNSLYSFNAKLQKVSLGKSLALSVRCINGEVIPISEIPTITTTEVSDILLNTAASGGTIIFDGGSAISAKGICWGTSQNPDINGNKTYEGFGSGSFTSSISNITANSIYYVRAYATNKMGTAYGNEQMFTTFTYDTVSDVDGNTYKTIDIGTQIWMAENLKTTRYNNGDTIPNVTDISKWKNLTSGAYCDYNNSPDSSLVYGRLYNWYTLVNPQNLCPEGWHVSRESEWTELITYVGGAFWGAGKLKETSSTHWKNPNYDASNETGFTALPGGYNSDGFFGIGSWGYWWSSTEFDTNFAYMHSLHYNGPSIGGGYSSKFTGSSLRCIKD